MPRTSPLTDGQLHICHQIKALRVALKISRSQFGTMAGMRAENLANKEAGRAPFRASEIERVKRAVSQHISDASSALENLDPAPEIVFDLRPPKQPKKHR